MHNKQTSMLITHAQILHYFLEMVNHFVARRPQESTKAIRSLYVVLSTMYLNNGKFGSNINSQPAS